jgi:hypothetical protein
MLSRHDALAGGIVHRDLKADRILVTLSREFGVGSLRRYTAAAFNHAESVVEVHLVRSPCVLEIPGG